MSTAAKITNEKIFSVLRAPRISEKTARPYCIYRASDVYISVNRAVCEFGVSCKSCDTAEVYVISCINVDRYILDCQIADL
jgi:hypothetical protein